MEEYYLKDVLIASKTFMKHLKTQSVVWKSRVMVGEISFLKLSGNWEPCQDPYTAFFLSTLFLSFSGHIFFRLPPVCGWLFHYSELQFDHPVTIYLSAVRYAYVGNQAYSFELHMVVAEKITKTVNATIAVALCNCIFQLLDIVTVHFRNVFCTASVGF